MINKDNFWKNKKILITGITGFLGSWMTIWALENSAKIIGISRTEGKSNSNFSLCKLKEKVNLEIGSIVDREFLEKVCEKYTPDFIIHLAGQPIDNDLTEDLRETYETNVLGTLAVLECIRKYDFIQGCVFLTSSKCYFDTKWETVYSKSKGCADILIETYRNTYLKKENKQAIVNFISCNVIGGGDFGKNRLVPACIRTLIDGDKIQLKSPEAKLYLSSVFEVIEGIYDSLEKELSCEKRTMNSFYELKNKKYVKIKDLAGLIEELYLKNVNINDDKVQELNVSVIDDSEKIEFSGQLSMKDILINSIEWYEKYSGDDLYELCRKQLQDCRKQLKEIGT